jgi:hypothetical protein
VNNTNNQSARASYLHAKQMFFNAFRGNFTSDDACWEFVNQLKLTQGETRFELQLLANQSTYTFGVNPQQSNTNNIVFNTERRLPQQDSICVNEYEIEIGAPSSQTAVDWIKRTYPNTQDFAAAGLSNALWSTFYGHGYFRLTVNNDVIIPYRGLANHLYVPQTQQTAALGAAAPGDQYRGAEDALITAEPNFVLIGSKNNEPQIVLPAAIAQVAGLFTRVVLTCKGIYAQNSTVVS